MQNNSFSKFDVLIDSFLANKVGTDEQFLSAALVKGLRENIQVLQEKNFLVKAGIGNQLVKDKQQQMRSDTIYWLDKKHQNIFEEEFLHQIEDLIEYLNKTCYTGINSYEFHYAVYAPGTFYKRHKDQFQNNRERKFSLISYLNKDWLESDGGKLITYQQDEGQSILPESGSAVFFKSEETEHEVTIANRSRLSITGWLKQV